jgi:transcriptional activator SPT8
LNTGQVVRTFTKHRGQISTLQLKPANVGPGIGNSLAPSLMIGSEEDEQPPQNKEENVQDGDRTKGINGDGDVEMEDVQKKGQQENGEGSDYDSLFGDEDGEKQDEDADEKSAPTQGGSADASENGGPSHTAKDADFPFGGSPAVADTKIKPPIAKPAKHSTRPNVQGKQGLPTLTPATYRQFSDDVMLVSAIDGEVALHDRRISGNTLVGKLESSEKTPPWCMSVSQSLSWLHGLILIARTTQACFSSDGQQVVAGRRNASLDVWDVRRMGRSGTKETPNLLRTLKHPATSGPVSCVAAFPDAQHIAV